MRVLLILPIQPTVLVITNFPAGFAYLASALKSAGHQVSGLNLNNLPDSVNLEEMLLGSLQKNKPQLIGIGGLCGDFTFLKWSISIIKKYYLDIPIVCGGKIIDNDKEFIFQTLHPDFCIIGEGEEVIVQLANMIESGQKDFDDIPNLGYWKEGYSKYTRENFNYGDINKRSFPDYTPFGIDELLDNYSLANNQIYRYSKPYPRVMIIITARNCPFNCSFCVHQHGSKYRARTIENIIDEIRFLRNRYNFNVLSIQDELFAGNKKRFKEFCSALIDLRKNHGLDFDWMFQTHASANLGYEELKLAKEAGCYNFCYGVESASPKVLESMNKKTKPSQFIEAIHLANKVQIGFSANLIFGDLAETPETFLESIEFFLNYCLDTNISIGLVKPFPGSRLFDYCIEKGLIDKLAFYENNCAGDINMTSMPDKLWLSWITTFCRRIFSQGWHIKTVESFCCIKDDEYCFNLYKEGNFVLKVWACCPHCGKDVFYREPINEGTYLIRGCTNCHKLIRIHIQKHKNNNRGTKINGERELQPDQMRKYIYNNFLACFRDRDPDFQLPPAYTPFIRQHILEKAEKFFYSGREEEAISYMMHTLKGMSADVECEFNLILYLAKKNRLSEAINRLETLIEAFPENDTMKTLLNQLTNTVK